MPSTGQVLKTTVVLDGVVLAFELCIESARKGKVHGPSLTHPKGEMKNHLSICDQSCDTSPVRFGSLPAR